MEAELDDNDKAGENENDDDDFNLNFNTLRHIVPIAKTSKNWKKIYDDIVAATEVKIEDQEPRKLKW